MKIAWYVNGTLASNVNSISTSGEGSHISSLIIPGYPQYNNSEIECYAFGSVNGINYINNSVVILQIQGNTLSLIYVNVSIVINIGKLTMVGNLLCDRQDNCIICSWYPPFSLVPIPSYIVNITNDSSGELVNKSFTANTNWTFCIIPSQFSTYTISVAGNNTAGEGEINTTTKEINTGQFKKFILTFYY